VTKHAAAYWTDCRWQSSPSLTLQQRVAVVQATGDEKTAQRKCKDSELPLVKIGSVVRLQAGPNFVAAETRT